MLFIPTYFAPIAQYIAILKYDKIIFEVEDNFQKQTYRNRCNIYAANGKLQLNIPIIHSKGIRQKTKDVKIDYSSNWQKQHFKSIEIAYRSSPYFEFYESDLRPIYEKKQEFLLDFNLKCHHFIMDALQENISFSKTNIYEINTNLKDYRNLAVAKKVPIYGFEKYYQVFSDKHGFIENLSVLDLLFMFGPTTEDYLKNNSIYL